MTTAASRIQSIGPHIDRSLDGGLPLCVPSLADVACMSPSHFYRAFKAIYGMTPADYVFSRRMALACRLLAEEPQLRVEDICYRCGFSSLSHFFGSFKRYTGQTPAQYRSMVLPQEKI